MAGAEILDPQVPGTGQVGDGLVVVAQAPVSVADRPTDGAFNPRLAREPLSA